jgi:hypothetical protein
MKKMAKPKEEKQPQTRKQLGVQVDIKQWRRFRALAFEKGQLARDMLKEAIEEYLVKHGQKRE